MLWFQKRSSDQSVSLSMLPVSNEDQPESSSSQDEAFSRQVSMISNRFTTSEESSSDDDDDEDNAEDTQTLGENSDCGGLSSRSLQTSTLTLVLDSQSEILEEDSVAGRLMKVCFLFVFIRGDEQWYNLAVQIMFGR